MAETLSRSIHHDEDCGRAWARWGGLRCIVERRSIRHDGGAGVAVHEAEVLGGKLQAQRGAGRQDGAQPRGCERYTRNRRRAAQRQARRQQALGYTCSPVVQTLHANMTENFLLHHVMSPHVTLHPVCDPWTEPLCAYQLFPPRYV